MLLGASKRLKIPRNAKVDLRSWDQDWVPTLVKECEEKEGKEAAKLKTLEAVEANRKELIRLQELVWASDTYSMLIVLQGMDTAGKDSIISHVMSGVNPQGCEVHSFKTPSEEEFNHNFLWRYMKALPERGRIGIFNRSYYEDVLIVKVRPEILQKQKFPPELIGKRFWKERYDDINKFERHLTRNGTVVLKFFLHISKEEQRQRLINRLENPDKTWKFSTTDLSERAKWKEYMKAYENVLTETNTEWAPWYVIPADQKLVARAAIAEILVAQIENLNLKYPSLTEEQRATLEKARAELKNE
jgi:PPK2 family polyphosphate:nucleotide phosphotransferase